MSDFSRWSLWLDSEHSASVNMAVDEVLMTTAKQPVLRLYDWSEPAITIGICQHFEKTRRAGHKLVRRITGGGVVDHTNSYTYTLVFPASHPIAAYDTLRAYQLINETVDRAIVAMGINSALTDEEIKPEVDRRVMACASHPTKYDIVKGEQKISGCAQRRMQKAILHQGYIDQRVGDWKVLKEQLISVFTEMFKATPSEFSPDQKFNETVDELVKSKYDCDKWNSRR